MELVFKIKKRRVIPRLRSFEASAQTGELDLTASRTPKPDFNTRDFLVEQKDSWNQNKNLAYAGDLLSSAYVLGVESEFLEVAKFVVDKDEDVNSPLSKIAKKTLSISNIEEENLSNDTQYFDANRYYSQARKFKFYLRNEPRNPMAWIELGRIYSILGHVEKAKKCFDRGLFLDKNNRFIVRSASRFYHHFIKDEELALRIIKGSEFINYDPWLLSAEIAYSTVLNRFSKMTKRGKQFLEDMNLDQGSITELASAIGTVELSNGKMRDAKKYFVQSLIKPNDNSLAQAEWLSNSINGIYVEQYKHNLPLAFEANTISSYEKGKYSDAFKSAIKWKEDEPYSTSPVLTASYIAATFLDNRTNCINLLRDGLKINPDDYRLNNNLVYFLALDNQVDEALRIFRARLYNTINANQIDIDQISIIATAGLLLYRQNLPEEGKKFYLRAIKLAEKAGNDYLLASALGNFLREEIRVATNIADLNSFISRFKKMSEIRTEADIKLLYDEVISAFEKLRRIETLKKN